jgi:hypothetical protein
MLLTLNPPDNDLTATFDDRAVAIVTWSDRASCA